jgi:hypothetical protein
MLNLQEAVRELIELEVRISTGQAKGQPAVELANRHGIVCWLVLTLGSRVADADTRQAVIDLAHAGGDFGKATGASTRNRAADRVNELAGTVLGRSGGLIRVLFDGSEPA